MDKNKSQFFHRLFRKLKERGIEHADPLLKEDPTLTPEQAVTSYGRYLLDNSPQPEEDYRFR